jgi:hypothetical protein
MRMRAWWTALGLVVAAGACGDQLTEVGTEPDAALTASSLVLDPATKLAFGQQPTSALSMQTISPAVTVRVLDAANVLVTTSAVPVTLAFGSNPAGGTLSGTLTRNAVNGVATFPDLSVARAASYTLRATSPGLTAASSASFVIIRGPAARLAFAVQPSGGDPGRPFLGQPRVAVQDAGGNLISTGSGSTSRITLAVEPGTGSDGSALSCTTNPINAAAGVASFAGCAIDQVGRGYRLRATNGTLPAGVSEPFDVGNPNRAPVVDAGGPYSATEGTALLLAPEVTDPDGDPLTYRWTVATTGLEAGGQCLFDDATAKQATITCTDDSEAAAGGRFVLTLEVSDGSAAGVVATGTITLGNASPTIGGLTGPDGNALPATILVGATLDLRAAFGDAGRNDTHTAAIECEPDAGFSGLGSVTSPFGAGCTFATVGARTIRVRVTDDDGGSALATQAVTVVYGLEGFFAPVQRPNTLNPYRAGQAIPLKWRLTDFRGAPVTTLQGVTVTARGLACAQGGTTDQVEEYAARGAGLQNLGDGYYQVVWKTPASYASSCKSVALALGPGYRTEPLANFTFKK